MISKQISFYLKIIIISVWFIAINLVQRKINKIAYNL